MLLTKADWAFLWVLSTDNMSTVYYDSFLPEHFWTRGQVYFDRVVYRSWTSTSPLSILITPIFVSPNNCSSCCQLFNHDFILSLLNNSSFGFFHFSNVLSKSFF